MNASRIVRKVIGIKDRVAPKRAAAYLDLIFHSHVEYRVRRDPRSYPLGKQADPRSPHLAKSTAEDPNNLNVRNHKTSMAH